MKFLCKDFLGEKKEEKKKVKEKIIKFDELV